MLAFFVALAVAALAQPVFGQDPPKPRMEMAPMRDGVQLATDIYLPGGTGPWPVVLVRTPYGRKGQGRVAAGYLRSGYAFVSQDWRGLFDSEGKFTPEMVVGKRNQEDGYDAVEWIARQAWSNGKVGVTGGSGPGIAAKQTVVSNPPHLVAAVTNVSCIYTEDREAYEGGAHPTQTDSWIAGRGFQFETWPRPRSFPFEGRPAVWPPQHKDAAKAGRIALLDTGGWFDIFSPCLFIDQSAFRGANNRTVVLPRGHGANLAGELKYPGGESPAVSAQAWFNHWLKGEDNGAAAMPRYSYYLMGDTMDPAAPGNRWMRADQWPVPSAPKTFFLNKDHGLSASAGNGELSYAYDPKHPAPGLGGPNLGTNNGPQDQRQMAGRPDVLRFASEPLTEPLEITGKSAVELSLSTDVTDTMLVVKVIDIYPNGYEALMLDQGFLARYRKGFNKPMAVEPGKPQKVRINLWDTALVFNKGHRIGLYITGSETPRYEVHPNTFAPASSYEGAPVAHVTVHLGASKLILPAVAAGVSKAYAGSK